MSAGDFIIMGGTGGTSHSDECITISGGDNSKFLKAGGFLSASYYGHPVNIDADPDYGNSIEFEMAGTPTVKRLLEQDNTLRTTKWEFSDISLVASPEPECKIEFADSNSAIIDVTGTLQTQIDELSEKVNGHTEELYNLEWGNVSFADGYAFQPSMNFTNDNMGFYRKGYGEIGVAVGGDNVASFDCNGVHAANIDSLEANAASHEDQIFRQTNRITQLDNRITQLENEIMALRSMTNG